MISIQIKNDITLRLVEKNACKDTILEIAAFPTLLEHDGLQAFWMPLPGVLYGYLTDWTGFYVKLELQYFEKALYGYVRS